MNLDAFFADHCNLLDTKNPCSCAAWIAFRASHEENQVQMKTALTRLDYREKGYRFDAAVRAKVNYLYSHMPEAKPSESWFSKIIGIFA